VVENPPVGEDTVIYSQHGATVDERAIGQGAFCELFGGTVEDHYDFEFGFRDTTCFGGLLDGMYCTNGELTACVWARLQTPDTTAMTPVPAREQPVEMTPTHEAAAPTATPLPPTATAPPTPSPTAVPTIELVEATAVPTQNLPDPKNDTNVPPGDEAEIPAEPAPTDAPLT
jgi:hypothetical protein